MDFLEIEKNSKYINEVEKLYLDAFPEIERLSFEELINNENGKIIGFIIENELIGFSYVRVLGQFAYIVYLAIDKDKRNKGLGSQALKIIDKIYFNKTKVLCVEKPKLINNIRTRRIGFYRRNGFVLTNFQFEYYGEIFYSMYKGEFDKQKFIKFLLTCFPDCKNFIDFDVK